MSFPFEKRQRQAALLALPEKANNARPAMKPV
jgi:hypothetical protein